MDSQQMMQPLISVEEIYAYDVDVGIQSSITWNAGQSSIKVRVIIPYDGQLTYDDQPLSKLSPAPATLHLGDVVCSTLEDNYELARVAVDLPAGDDLAAHVLSGQQFVQKWQYAAQVPPYQLVSVEGKVFDGTDDNDQDELLSILRDEGKNKDFINDLRLRLSLWVPDLFDRNRREKYRKLIEVLRDRENSQQVCLPFVTQSDEDTPPDDLFDVTRLAQNLAALANNPQGGRIILGVNPGTSIGDTRDTVKAPATEPDSDASVSEERATDQSGHKTRRRSSTDQKDIAGGKTRQQAATEQKDTVRSNAKDTKKFNNAPFTLGKDKADWESAVEQALVKALARCTPAIPISVPEYFRSGDSVIAAYITVPERKDVSEIYRCDETMYVRKGNLTTPTHAPKLPPIKRKRIAGLSARHLEDVVQIGSTDDVIVIDAKHDLDDLGQHMCGLINSEQHGGLLVIHNLPLPTNSSWFHLPIRMQLQRDLDKLIERELDRCAPRPVVSKLHMMRFRKEYIAVLQVEAGPVAIALYQQDEHTAPEGYCWEERDLVTISLTDLITLYRKHMGVTPDHDSDEYRANVTYAEVGWPIQPALKYRYTSATTKGVYAIEGGSEGTGAYDIQRQAIIWRDQPFTAIKKQTQPVHGADQQTKAEERQGQLPKLELHGTGFQCHLDASLRSGLMTVDSNGIAKSLDSSNLNGQIGICFDDLLVSGMRVGSYAAAKTGDWFDHIPVKRSTKLLLNVQVHADELFKHRRKQSLFQFFIPDTTLDKDRISDIRQAFTDLGFRTGIPYRIDEDQVWISGVRSKKYCDIRFLALIQCNRSGITRHLRYGQRYDVKRTQTARIECRVALSGKGEQVAADIAQLHLAIHQLLNQRLHYLHVE